MLAVRALRHLLARTNEADTRLVAVANPEHGLRLVLLRPLRVGLPLLPRRALLLEALRVHVLVQLARRAERGLVLLVGFLLLVRGLFGFLEISWACSDDGGRVAGRSVGRYCWLAEFFLCLALLSCIGRVVRRADVLVWNVGVLVVVLELDVVLRVGSRAALRDDVRGVELVIFRPHRQDSVADIVWNNWRFLGLHVGSLLFRCALGGGTGWRWHRAVSSGLGRRWGRNFVGSGFFNALNHKLSNRRSGAGDAPSGDLGGNFARWLGGVFCSRLRNGFSGGAGYGGSGLSSLSLLGCNELLDFRDAFEELGLTLERVSIVRVFFEAGLDESKLGNMSIFGSYSVVERES